MRPRRTTVKRKICLLCSMLPLFFLFVACGGGSGESTNNSSSRTGTISFNLVWQHPADQRWAVAGGRSPSGNVCVDYAIDSIAITVRNSSGTEVASANWRCDTHQGTVSSVPVGSGITLALVGAVGDHGDWQGQAAGITVNANQNTNVGAIEMTYIGSDDTSPTASYLYPLDGATDIPINASIVVNFSENIVAASANTSSCTLRLAGSINPVTCTVSYIASQQRVTIDPIADLAPNSEYVVTISSEIEDLASNQMEADYSWSFTTRATPAQTLIWGEGNWGDALWN